MKAAPALTLDQLAEVGLTLEDVRGPRAVSGTDRPANEKRVSPREVETGGPPQMARLAPVDPPCSPASAAAAAAAAAAVANAVAADNTPAGLGGHCEGQGVPSSSSPVPTPVDMPRPPAVAAAAAAAAAVIAAAEPHSPHEAAQPTEGARPPRPVPQRVMRWPSLRGLRADTRKPSGGGEEEVLPLSLEDSAEADMGAMAIAMRWGAAGGAHALHARLQSEPVGPRQASDGSQLSARHRRAAYQSAGDLTSLAAAARRAVGGAVRSSSVQGGHRHGQQGHYRSASMP